MIGEFDCFVQLTGTVPGGPALAIIPALRGTITMDRTWAPAVRAEFVFPFREFDATSLQLVDPSIAQFVQLFLVDAVTGRQALWELNVRGYTIDARAETLTLVLASYEALVQDYGSTQNSINLSDTSIYPTALSMVQSLVNTAVGTTVGAGWTAPSTGSVPAAYEGRFVVPGGNVWEYVQQTVSTSPGGAVQHFGWGTSGGDSLEWLLSAPTYERTPAHSWVVPAYPDPDASLDPGDVEPTAWTVQRSRDVPEWGNAMYLEFPRRMATGTATLITAGTTFNYEFSNRGLSGSTSALRKQVQVSTRTYPDTSQGDRNTRAGYYLSRRAPLGRAQTVTVPMDLRLVPYQVYPDPNGVEYMVRSVMHNLTDGTSVVQLTATP
ncbi:hypothetical protein [Promicromonospora sp. NPDC050880]|uniref:hypothetical protein n=1 Tax=Promicromonospora sp. NPDC050880 TaxID=3364406 RepID=UPI0037A177EC